MTRKATLLSSLQQLQTASLVAFKAIEMKTAGESTAIRDAGKIPLRQLGDAMLEAFEHLPSYYQYYPQHDQYLSRQVYLDAAAKYIRVLK